ncbi:hypothetical protein D9757_004344 [Collybiopsis confluens]|uniref:Major facilitator superfamily (MFS) profile domain-containing protein n=1 Tax=Collybiopsis confluens TaxID=2823264 RepID=A0A8H5HUL2_9AGAR|nr:hypothetical protein D9757_004344 [Collybiopsis confluens]
MSALQEKPWTEKRDNGSLNERANSHDDSFRDLSAKLANPLTHISHDQLVEDAKVFAQTHGLEDLVAEFQKGALVAQDPSNFENLTQLDEEDKRHLRRELTHKWDQPKMLYYLVILCSMAAAVQGMDETVTNGANLFFAPQFGLDINDPDKNKAANNQWLLGLVNSAPYLCCAVLGCWLTDPLNRVFGRRGTIFITALLSFLACIWQGVTNSWEHLFVARFVLGLAQVGFSGVPQLARLFDPFFLSLRAVKFRYSQQNVPRQLSVELS